jgi:hypothetical protein
VIDDEEDDKESALVEQKRLNVGDPEMENIQLLGKYA